MISKEKLDDVVARINRVLTIACGEETPFVIIVMETHTDPVKGPGVVLRSAGNTNQDMARDMLVEAARFVLETEYEAPAQPPEATH